MSLIDKPALTFRLLSLKSRRKKEKAEAKSRRLVLSKQHALCADQSKSSPHLHGELTSTSCSSCDLAAKRRSGPAQGHIQRPDRLTIQPQPCWHQVPGLWDTAEGHLLLCTTLGGSMVLHRQHLSNPPAAHTALSLGLSLNPLPWPFATSRLPPFPRAVSLRTTHTRGQCQPQTWLINHPTNHHHQGTNAWALPSYSRDARPVHSTRASCSGPTPRDNSYLFLKLLSERS